MFFFCFVIAVVALFVFLTFFLSFSLLLTSSQKSAPFECGFYPLGSFSFVFSISFFIISLMFLLFDVEILLICLLPLVSSFSFFSFKSMWVVLLLILFSTLYEWVKGVLVWV